MMPGRQAWRVQLKPGLPRQRTADHFSGSKDRSPLSAEADRFTKFDKMFRFEFAAFDESTHIGSQQAGLLKRQLRSSRERRHDVFIERDIPQRENVLVTMNLQCWLDHNQPAPIFFDFELLHER